MNKILIGVLVALLAVIAAKGVYIKKILNDRATLQQNQEQLVEAVKTHETSYARLQASKDAEIALLNRSLERQEVVNRDYDQFAKKQAAKHNGKATDNPELRKNLQLPRDDRRLATSDDISPSSSGTDSGCINVIVSSDLVNWVYSHKSSSESAGSSLSASSLVGALHSF